MNQIQLVGRLTKDPELKQTQSGTAVCRFAVAVDRRGKKEEGKPTADYPDCVAFGKVAEFIAKWFGKGKPIGITGHIQTGKYENREGRTVYTTDIIVDNAEFVGSKADSDSGGARYTKAQYAPIQSEPAPAYDSRFSDELPPMDLDPIGTGDLPF